MSNPVIDERRELVAKINAATKELNAASAVLLDLLTQSLKMELVVTTRATGLSQIEMIQRIVARIYDLPMEDMTSKRRPVHVAGPRMVAMMLCREMTTCSLAEIGEAFGGRDHGTVSHAFETIRRRAATDKDLAGRLQTVRNLFQEPVETSA